jgi:hypothetical protein
MEGGDSQRCTLSRKLKNSPRHAIVALAEQRQDSAVSQTGYRETKQLLHMIIISYMSSKPNFQFFKPAIYNLLVSGPIT